MTHSKVSLTVGQVAQLCRLDRTTVFRWIKGGRINAWRTPGGHYRIDADELAVFSDSLKNVQLDWSRLKDMPEAVRLVCLTADDVALEACQQAFEQAFPSYQLSVAADEIVGCVRVGAVNPSVMVVDAISTEVDWDRVVASLMNDTELGPLDIIAICDPRQRELTQMLQRAGVRAIVARPVDPKEMLAALKRVVKQAADRKRRQRERERRKKPRGRGGSSSSSGRRGRKS